MKFIRIKKHKIRETWVYHNILKGYFIYIYLLPSLTTDSKKFYYFHVKFLNGENYISLNNNCYYEGLENIIKAIEDWLVNYNIKRKD